jgi:hypothetical protein
MSFLEDLENNKIEDKEENIKTPRKLWESCFKYFQHFTSIIQKEGRTFESEFNFTFLNRKEECIITGPYEIQRMQNDMDLKFEVKMLTQFKNSIKINRKDKRSAELLNLKLLKDGILSSVKVLDNKYYIELSNTLHSTFKIILKNNNDFTIEYQNIMSTSKRSIKLAIENINEEYMDNLAKYILGKNPTLYTETISDQEITKIREKVKLGDKRVRQIEADVQAEIKKQEELDKIRRANTLKAKSKKYIKSQSSKLIHKFSNTIKNILDK